MDLNKKRCKTLKQIRKKMADALEIDLHQTECTYEGTCSGTCPKCKQEEQQLNRALLGKTALAAGAVGISLSLAGCTSDFGQLEGDTIQVSTEQVDLYEGMPETEALSEDSEVETSTEDMTEEYELEGDIAYTEED